MKTKHLLIALFLMLAGSLSIFAQKKQAKTDSNDKKLTVVVDTKDGSRFVGKFIERRADTVVLQTETMGLIYLAESQIKSIDEVGKIREGSSNPSWFRNPYATQGVFFPTGIGLKKGEGNYQNLMVGFNSVHYGITDNFSIGGGLEIITFAITGKPAVVYFEPKLSYSFTENVHVSGGTYLFAGGFDTNLGTAALPFANLTYGNRDNNITIGTYFSTNGGQLFLLGGHVRAARKFSFIGEIYIGDGSTLITLGGRFMTETFNLNFGLFTPNTLGSRNEVFAIPYIGFTIPFGHKDK